MIVEAASDEYDDTENSKKQNASEYVNVPIEQKHLNRIVRHGLGKNSLGGFPSWMVRYASICIRFAEFERKVTSASKKTNYEEKDTIDGKCKETWSQRSSSTRKPQQGPR